MPEDKERKIKSLKKIEEEGKQENSKQEND